MLQWKFHCPLHTITQFKTTDDIEQYNKGFYAHTHTHTHTQIKQAKK